MRSENYQLFSMEGLKFGTEMGNNVNRRALRDINNLTSGATYRLAVVERNLNGVAPIDNKNTNRFAGGRPITRRFAASIARQSLDCLQNASRLKPIGSERQKRSQPVQNTTCIETCEAIDEYDIVSPNGGGD